MNVQEKKAFDEIIGIAERKLTLVFHRPVEVIAVFPPNIPIHQLVYEACNIWGIEVSCLFERSRKTRNVCKRQILSLLLRKQTKLSLNKIAQNIGYSDHTDVIYALRKAENYKGQEDEEFMKYYTPVEHLFSDTDVRIVNSHFKKERIQLKSPIKQSLEGKC